MVSCLINPCLHGKKGGEERLVLVTEHSLNKLFLWIFFTLGLLGFLQASHLTPIPSSIIILDFQRTELPSQETKIYLQLSCYKKTKHFSEFQFTSTELYNAKAFQIL